MGAAQEVAPQFVRTIVPLIASVVATKTASGPALRNVLIIVNGPATLIAYITAMVLRRSKAPY